MANQNAVNRANARMTRSPVRRVRNRPSNPRPNVTGQYKNRADIEEAYGIKSSARRASSNATIPVTGVKMLEGCIGMTIQNIFSKKYYKVAGCAILPKLDWVRIGKD